MPRLAVHGVNVREVDDSGLVAQVLERHVGEVEVDTLQQQVGGDEDIRRAVIVELGGIVANGHHRGGVAGGETGGETVDEAEFSQT